MVFKLAFSGCFLGSLVFTFCGLLLLIEYCVYFVSLQPNGKYRNTKRDVINQQGCKRLLDFGRRVL